MTATDTDAARLGTYHASTAEIYAPFFPGFSQNPNSDAAAPETLLSHTHTHTHKHK